MSVTTVNSSGNGSPADTTFPCPACLIKYCDDRKAGIRAGVELIECVHLIATRHTPQAKVDWRWTQDDLDNSTFSARLYFVGACAGCLEDYVKLKEFISKLSDRMLEFFHTLPSIYSHFAGAVNGQPPEPTRAAPNSTAPLRNGFANHVPETHNDPSANAAPFAPTIVQPHSTGTVPAHIPSSSSSRTMEPIAPSKSNIKNSNSISGMHSRNTVLHPQSTATVATMSSHDFGRICSERASELLIKTENIEDYGSTSPTTSHKRKTATEGTSIMSAKRVCQKVTDPNRGPRRPTTRSQSVAPASAPEPAKQKQVAPRRSKPTATRTSGSGNSANEETWRLKDVETLIFSEPTADAMVRKGLEEMFFKEELQSASQKLRASSTAPNSSSCNGILDEIKLHHLIGLIMKAFNGDFFPKQNSTEIRSAIMSQLSTFPPEI
ncbi:uncharacterized protein LOC129594549 isoform X2 [Paramacrobiotus metropolitanus]|uniref:uncharacterized protein LOC129594549 isoform X2 n=1 Tax=Paramacrobiotus metropolitanus TaxID=2943436 RepID=UPI002445C785|nr:uncharacterized protein LOC129594549 isoform X2 [Paramacrobiotus metropolitanus]